MRVGDCSRSLVLGAMLAAACVHAVGAQSLDAATVRRIDSVFARFTPETPGCAAGVYQNGRVLFAKGYGSANIEYSVPITPQTPFIMGSVSKQFTAAAIALLVQDGRIRLDDDVHKYVPELPDYGKKITIDQLVHHTSGVRDFWSLVDASGMRQDDGYTVADVVKLASRQQHLNFDPGAEYNYSNTGYVLLGVIVQRASGKSLREFAAERIFRPLGMTVSHFHDDHTQPVRGRAIAYSPLSGGGGGWKINVWNNDIVGQGGLMTTLEELQKWDENFYTGTVGGWTLLSRQLERGVLNDGKQIAYAFGLEIGEYRGLPMVEHSGSTGGYRSDITRFPEQHTSLATICNVSNADAVGLAHRMADVVLGSRFTKPATANVRGAGQVTAPAIALTQSERAAMTGRFYSPELDATYELRDAGDALIVVRARAVDTLRALDRQTFRGSGYTLHFAASNGAPTFTLDAGRIRGIEFTRSK